MMFTEATKNQGNGHDLDRAQLAASPEPTRGYALRRAELRIDASRAIPIPGSVPLPKIPIPLPINTGSRFRIWKQDPSVGDPGLRLAFLPGYVANGPRDLRITTELPGTTPVQRNLLGDFIFVPGTPEMDCAHAWAVVRQTLSMYERVLRSSGGAASILWAWNTGGNTDVLTVYPRAGQTPNAYYSRGGKALKFFYFTPTGATEPVYTCRSLDIVAHETGHAVLDGLKPGWLGWGNPPQTGGLHESFGDLTAIFLALSQLDQVEALIALSRANLHAKNFLAELAEQFGNALGRPTGLRNADNDLKLSDVSTEVHDLSQVFTGGVYDYLADVFAYEKYQARYTKDAAQVLLEVGRKVCSQVLRALIAAPANAATYFDVVTQMLAISQADGEPEIHRTFLRNRFIVREVLSGTPVDAPSLADPQVAPKGGVKLVRGISDAPGARQSRCGCCGTMQSPEYFDDGAGAGEDVLLRQQQADLEASFR